ncbi:MAG: FAD-dependent oxidoreductase [Candidatus Nealsonbacteria bacterium]|nr:FAD-dependent oxidoreductase [Candidatus Nealsonbacteria bacterium]
MKTAIVGAGINGLYLARHLSKKGHEVFVFEKRNKIGKEACSGLFSQRILDFIPQSRGLIQNEINSALIHFPKKTVKVIFSKKFFVMSHFELDNLLAGLAEKAGVKIALNHSIADVSSLKDFERIIGCDGPNSAIRKSLGAKDFEIRLAVQGFLQKKDDSDFVETWPINQGFIWRIPRGEEVEYGAIGKAKEVKTIFDGFLKKNNLALERIVSAIVPYGFLFSSKKEITLCGDAAGLCKPWSGGGVVWGLIAANMLLKNFPDFIKYKKAVKVFFIPRIILSKIAVRLVYFFGFHFSWILPKRIKMESDFLF